jgi:transposase
MSHRFRVCTLDQPLLLPPSLQDWLPEGHLARFVADVTEQLDLSPIYAAYTRRDGRGQLGYHPLLLTRLLLYGYCLGVSSSRKIERKTHDDVAFRFLAADQHPDHDTIASFRQRHLEALAGLFLQALRMCQKAGLVKLGHVAIDGTKVKANASKHKAMSYARMSEAEQKLQQEVEELLRCAEATDAAEDALYGKGNRGDELPAELARRESRLRKIREAKAALEAEAKQRAEKQKAAVEAKLAERRKQETETGRKVGGREPEIPDPEQARPEAKAQRNFTDPDSRIMPDGANKGRFVQGYNAQAAVDSEVQVIVAADLVQATNDKQQLAPMVKQTATNLGAKPAAVSADAGYWSEANVTDERVTGIDLYVATGRKKDDKKVEPVSESPPENVSEKEKMASKLRTGAGQAVYKMRKAIVEPVFGQIKEARGIRRFSMRGLGKVRAEWQLICLTHNLLKLHRSGWQPQGV